MKTKEGKGRRKELRARKKEEKKKEGKKRESDFFVLPEGEKKKWV